MHRLGLLWDSVGKDGLELHPVFRTGG
jgi:hypothetical protein